ncbi:hypothetical protein [Nostoc sp.]
MTLAIPDNGVTGDRSQLTAEFKYLNHICRQGTALLCGLFT